MEKLKQIKLLPERHPNKDFFIADIFDGTPLKSDIASMAYPIFSLSRKKDVRELFYEKGNVSIHVAPSTHGLPTIFDKDVLLYCGSLIMQEINNGRLPQKTLRISARDLLISTNRSVSGRAYSFLKKSLDRLKGVSIKTNIKTNKREETSSFGVIDSYRVVESSKVKDRMVGLEITLSDWFYNSLLGKEVLTINRDYFRLAKPLERRIYEIARKHCGQNKEWRINIQNLKDKTGSVGTLNKFRFVIKQLEDHNHMPDYDMRLTENDIVVFERQSRNSNVVLNDLPSIKPQTIERGRIIVEKTGLNIDYENIRSQFTSQLMGGFSPDKVDGAFINFVKKKVEHFPKE